LQHFKAQEESHKAMQDLAEGMRILADQLDSFRGVQKSEELRNTINEFPGMMKEVVEFIDKWLESWSGAYSVLWNGLVTESLVAAKHILVVPHKEKTEETGCFRRKFRQRYSSRDPSMILCLIFVVQSD